MTEQERELLDGFEARVRHLAYLFQEARQKNTELQRLLDDEKQQSRQLQRELDSLRADYEDLKSGVAISLDGGDIQKAKQQISHLVREVDKCMALLNE